jgi:hypothetical protein
MSVGGLRVRQVGGGKSCEVKGLGISEGSAEGRRVDMWQGLRVVK